VPLVAAVFDVLKQAIMNDKALKKKQREALIEVLKKGMRAVHACAVRLRCDWWLWEWVLTSVAAGVKGAIRQT
jgi:hypothetical protein